YAFALQLCPHGRHSSPYMNYMGITFHLCSSVNDGLEWPAGRRQVVLLVLDQDPDVIHRMSLSLSFTTDPNQLVYGRNDTLQWDRPSVVGSSFCN
ncbi:MEP1A protein, partial [Ibidorhyncha struthersii]|nr:MEP1A protein [Ibidorhyncha struthersii]